MYTILGTLLPSDVCILFGWISVFSVVDNIMLQQRVRSDDVVCCFIFDFSNVHLILIFLVVIFTSDGGILYCIVVQSGVV
jgi:hypothetical protein